MSTWFVYSNATYYPEGMLVEAETPSAAAMAAQQRGLPQDEGVVVFPWEARKWLDEPHYAEPGTLAYRLSE